MLPVAAGDEADVIGTTRGTEVTTRQLNPRVLIVAMSLQEVSNASIPRVMFEDDAFQCGAKMCYLMRVGSEMIPLMRRTEQAIHHV